MGTASGKRRSSRLLLSEEFEPRLCLSGISFAMHVIHRAPVPQSVYAADMDGDHDLDLIWASFAVGEISWHENTDSRGSFGQQNVIAEVANGVAPVQAADLNHDGGAFGDGHICHW